MDGIEAPLGIKDLPNEMHHMKYIPQKQLETDQTLKMHKQSQADPSIHISSFNDETNMGSHSHLYQARKSSGLY